MAEESTSTSARVIVTEGGEETTMSAAEFQGYLERSARIEAVTTSITVTRSIPRDKFEKNQYFFSNTTSIGGLYDAAQAAGGDEVQIRKLLGNAILQRVQKGFDLGRVALKQQQQSDGITVVSLADSTTVL